mmetsp:Transcript_11192/g.27198  ORF Transcript_11192/g.27198 Transcript_11192/m.27198 type:complete len:220 (+) Transcript_11192:459-1118(+)
MRPTSWERSLSPSASNTSGITFSKHERKSEAFLIAALELWRMSETRKRRAILEGIGVSRMVRDSVMQSTISNAASARESANTMASPTSARSADILRSAVSSLSRSASESDAPCPSSRSRERERERERDRRDMSPLPSRSCRSCLPRDRSRDRDLGRSRSRSTPRSRLSPRSRERERWRGASTSSSLGGIHVTPPMNIWKAERRHSKSESDCVSVNTRHL